MASEPDFWRCKTCGCLWRDNHDDSVSLGSAKQTSCDACERQPTQEACEPLYREVAVAVRPRLGALDQQRIDVMWRLMKDVQSWGNSVKFTCYERLAGRPTQDDQWLHDVGCRIIAAADGLLAELRALVSSGAGRREEKGEER